ncbi:MAG: dTDP-4-dehydrorhamnose 3,5-epimerase family protein [Gemmataceae bacterium]|nr:dTDP-4-dehydrorhamnose 3,5-epimerase family protein [Gemmata sp.]MDW8198642.1 dTDP-4-dehydrorhamnose 3,5-epimerase family protein [Gemmataceae bacterium]
MNVVLPKYLERGVIADVAWIPLKFFTDARGWLVELFRNDLIPPPFHPVMAYVSMTQPGVVRGPHEHRDQADYFCFLGPSTFRVYLWDARPNSASFGTREVREVGENAPFAVIVPPGVVHAYKNIGTTAGWVFNAANRLYGGWLKQEPVDEIRHENDPNSPYRVE